MLLKLLSVSKRGILNKINNVKYLSYTQGQYIDKKTREYFYYIDHQGMLFLDDARMKNFTSCFKDKKFLAFFFKRLRENKTGRYEEEFPFISPCGREINFIKCDDRPVVFTHLTEKDGNPIFCYGHVDELFVPFQPNFIYMEPANGRVYHPAPPASGHVGLVCSKLAIEFSKDFEFTAGQESPPTHFMFRGKKYQLDQEWLENIKVGRRSTSES
uniref:Uncharacterized protein n=1 Tax=Homalodisca liturata TaxID=320908 RepID=A0A1B6HNQ3_9HEMI